MSKIEKYRIIFDPVNSNSILIYLEQRLHAMIACPPIDEGCDIINFDDKLSNGYTFNFDGLILITNKTRRRLYYKGKLIAHAKRTEK